jgi:hypothetical protein
MENRKQYEILKNMELKEKLSVMVMTHIINVSTEPYLNNEMIVKTIRTSHDKMKLHGVTYYVYVDSFFKENHPDYYETYVSNLFSSFEKELSDINVVIVSDATSTQKGNWMHMIEHCNTPYFMFLEHDWEFVEDIPTDTILNEMDKHEKFSYIRFSRWPAGHPQELRWDKSNGAMYEKETSIGVEVNLPLTKVGLYSGNPHIVKTQKCKDFYLPKILEHYPNIGDRNTYLEKEFLNIIVQDIQRYGQEKSHETWGTFLYGSLPEFEPVITHLGDWCRKS